jgi:hypothetical protein
MSTEEDTYNIIFKAMQHPIRRRILRTISEAPSTYTEIQKTLNIDNGLLNYHLDSMKDLITKDEEERYTLSEFGKATVNLVKGVEEPASTLLKGNTVSTIVLNKLFAACIIVIAVTSAAVIMDLNGKYSNLSEKYYTQGVALNQLQGEYSRLSESAKILNATTASSEKTYIIRESIRLSLNESTISRRVVRADSTIIILSNSQLENIIMPQEVGSVKLVVLSQEEIDAKASAEGPFLYLVFKEVNFGKERIYVSIDATGVFDSGAGCSISFFRQDGIWVGEITGGWIA